MKIKNLLLTLTLFIVSSVLAQSPFIKWENSLGSSENDMVLSSVSRGSDIALVGVTEAYPMDVFDSVEWKWVFSRNNGDVNDLKDGGDAWFVRIGKASGFLGFEQVYGGTGTDVLQSIDSTASGFIMAGWTKSNDGDLSGNHGQEDAWVINVNSNGGVIWSKCFGGSGYDRATSIKQTSDGGFIFIGYTFSNDGDVKGNHGTSDIWVVKLNSLGDIEWQKTIGGNSYDGWVNGLPIYGWKDRGVVTQTQDGNYILTSITQSIDGDFSSTGQSTSILIKLDKNGSIIYNKSLGVKQDIIIDLKPTSNGDLILSGIKGSEDYVDETGAIHIGGGSLGGWLIKVNQSGTIQWQKTIAGSPMLYSVDNTIDGGYITISSSPTPIFEMGVEKFDSNGDIVWRKKTGSLQQTVPSSVIEVAKNEYIFSAFAIGPGGCCSSKSSENSGDLTGLNQGNFDFWVAKLVPASVISETACNSYTYKGKTYTNNSIDTIETKTIYRNSSIRNNEILNLTINKSTKSDITKNICFGESFQFAGSLITKPGKYVDTIQNSLKCDSIITLTLNVSEETKFSLPPYININEKPFIMNGSPSGGTYLGKGAEINSFNPVIAGLGRKQITYKSNSIDCPNPITVNTIVYDTTGIICTSYDTSYTHISVTDTLIINTTLGLKPNQVNNIIKVYPNPASTHIYINTGNYVLMSGHSIKITNSIGQEVYNQQILKQEYYLDLSTWSGIGTYFITIVDPQGKIVDSKSIILK